MLTPLVSQLIDEASRDPVWARYARYLLLRSRGDRAGMMRELDAFASELSSSAEEERLRFVRWFLDRLSRDQTHWESAMPKPLRERIIRPTLARWSASAPSDPLPPWYFGFFAARDANESIDCYRDALRRSPSFAPAAQSFLRSAAQVAEFVTHELPHAHPITSDVAAELRLIREALSWNAASGDAPDARDACRTLVEAERRLVVWIAQRHLHP